MSDTNESNTTINEPNAEEPIQHHDPIQHHEVTETLLQRFEDHMKDMKVKAVTLHTQRMEQVRILLSTSGLDTQQQVRVFKEIHNIFNPFIAR